MNPGIPEIAIDEALARLADPRPSMSSCAANREAYGLIRAGISVEYEGAGGRIEHGIVKVIDFDRPEANEFLAVSQLWIKGERATGAPISSSMSTGFPWSSSSSRTRT